MEWYCVKIKMGSEKSTHLYLRDELGVESFLPMVPRPKLVHGMKRIQQECLFPGYLFVHIDLATEFRKVSHARGSRGFVRMGERYPSVSGRVVAALQRYCEELEAGAEQPLRDLAEGDSVELLGALRGGLTGEVAKLLPARNQVRVLIEFLGRQLELEIGAELALRVAS